VVNVLNVVHAHCDPKAVGYYALHIEKCSVDCRFCHSFPIQDGNSSVPRQALANGTEYALSTKMTPANVVRTYSEPKEKEKVQ